MLLESNSIEMQKFEITKSSNDNITKHYGYINTMELQDFLSKLQYTIINHRCKYNIDNLSDIFELSVEFTNNLSSTDILYYDMSCKYDGYNISTIITKNKTILTIDDLKDKYIESIDCPTIKIQSNNIIPQIIDKAYTIYHRTFIDEINRNGLPPRGIDNSMTSLFLFTNLNCTKSLVDIISNGKRVLYNLHGEITNYIDDEFYLFEFKELEKYKFYSGYKENRIIGLKVNGFYYYNYISPYKIKSITKIE